MDYKTTAACRTVIDGIPVFCGYDKIVPIDHLCPNPRNPNRHPAAQITKLAAIIAATGWRNNITVSSRSGLIVRGHGRLLAAQRLKVTAVPIEYQDYTSEAEELADLAADNRIAELSLMDNAALTNLLNLIIDDVPLSLAGFDNIELDTSDPSPDAEEDFDKKMAAAAELYGEDPGEYTEFLEKFKPKRTTDDCYTPPLIYDTVKAWACEKYGIDPDCIVRPFYPGGDYEHHEYPEGAVVLDNPPFSILSEICEFYLDRNIPFFLFAPSLTAFSGRNVAMRMNHIICDADITYANGAIVRTAFVTSYGGDIIAQTAPDLGRAIDAATAQIKAETKRKIPKYVYPDHILTAAMLQKYSKYGIEMTVHRGDCVLVSKMDAQKESGESIFGGGLLLSDRAAAEKAAAEKAAAEKASAHIWELSPRELEIIKSLGFG